MSPEANQGAIAMKIYRISTLSRISGKWENWYDYKTPDEAEIAAIGLIQGGAAAECQILDVRDDGGKIIAVVVSKPAPGFPHGKAVTKQ
jgi:hypothetical protein